MPAPRDVHIRRAKLKVSLTVRCRDCNTSEQSELIEIEVESVSLFDFEPIIARHPNCRIGTHFPVGWSGHGTYYLCPACTKK